MIKFEEKFKKGDIIICHGCKDIAVYDKTDKKGYMHFKEYYDRMFDRMKDVKRYTLQVNYQKMWNLCTQEEVQRFEDIKKRLKG